MFRMKVYHELMSYGLSLNALKICLYLHTCMNELHTAQVATRTIAANCRIASHATVARCIRELEQKGLIKKYTRRNYEGEYIANGYHIKPVRGKWFFFPSYKEVFALNKAEFAVYLYLCKCRNTKGRSWPSFNAMAAVLQVAKNTIINAIDGLISAKLITKGKLRPGKHNLYMIATSQPEPEPENTQKNSAACQLHHTYLEEDIAGKKVAQTAAAKNPLTSIIKKTIAVVNQLAGKGRFFLSRVVQKL